MSEWRVVDESDDVFDLLRANAEAKRDVELREVVLIARACDEYRVDLSRADAAAEKLILGGAEGTALVGEFLSLELAGLLEISPAFAALRIREILDLRDRHPELWELTLTGFVAPWRALKVAAACSSAGLSGEAARWVDHQLCLALAALPWGRVLRSLEGLIIKADTGLAALRAEQARVRRLVSVSDHREGGSQLFARLDTEDALALNRTITRVAAALAACGDTEDVDVRRATALGVLADPQAALDLLAGVGDGRPTNRTATVVVHVAAEDADVARVEHVGAVDVDTMRRFLANSSVVVRPVVDVNTVPPVDAYEVPARMRAHVLGRNPVEVFPYSARPSPGLDLDHTIPFDHGAPPGAAQTRAENLGPLSRRVHRAKTARVWSVTQTEPGVFRWTSPHGFVYEVSPEGTVALGRHSHRRTEDNAA